VYSSTIMDNLENHGHVCTAVIQDLTYLMTREL
jgi:hypothetical protein